MGWGVKLIVCIVLGVLALIIVFVVYRAIAFAVGSRRMANKRMKRIQPLRVKIDQGRSIGPAEVRPFFEDYSTRQDAFQLLFGSDQLDAVPQEYNNLRASAEGQLAIWLEFPTELDARPDEIRYAGRAYVEVEVEEEEEEKVELLYEVFLFRKLPPHWSADGTWAIGVVGPFEDEEMFPTEVMAFSRFTSLQGDNIEEEVKWHASRINEIVAGPNGPTVRFVKAEGS